MLRSRSHSKSTLLMVNLESDEKSQGGILSTFMEGSCVWFINDTYKV